MSDQILTKTKESTTENSSTAVLGSKHTQSACHMLGKGSLKGGLAMAVCCAAPLILFAAVVLFGISLGELASGFLSVATLLACPVGMYLMMRMMMKDKSK